MRGSPLLAALLLASSLAAGLPVPGRGEEPAHRRLVVISIDGLAPESYLAPVESGPEIPNLRRLMARGAWASAVVGVLPTNTYPSHATLLTGVPPRLHGIFGNRIFDPLEKANFAWYWYARQIRVPTLATAAKARGLTVASLFWPTSVGLDADALVPEFWRTGSQSEADRDLLRALSTPGLVDCFEREQGRPFLYPPTDVERTDVALSVVRASPPDLLLLHLVEHDAAKHHDGLGAASVRTSLEGIDIQLGRIVEEYERQGLAGATLFAVVSDHGFLPTETEIRPNVLLRDAGLLTVGDDGKVSTWRAIFWTHGGTAMLRLAEPTDQEALQKVRALFAARLAEPDSGIRALLEPEEIKALGGDPEETPFGLDAEAGFYFQVTASGEATGPAIDRAGHGFAPTRPELFASFVVAGPGLVGSGDLGSIAMTRIAPTLAHWLGLELDPRADAPLGLFDSPDSARAASE